ncbi:inorganic phosphate transporter [Arenibacter sp. F26102]|uniref:inorganic phosphate transporter n=1 Tax=Arenibacter sp. F26102 TaxID=2926416 RepID=UPI001FF58166|nr:inorganic phosphate transporter [Arenibacter sp. F26102]MCK0144227.1 inorganic phosphate transporter [Arenibacter sp. F26102]
MKKQPIHRIGHGNPGHCDGNWRLLNTKKVGHAVSKEITPLNHGQGFTANLIKGLLVKTASIHGPPISTTHVSVGSIFGNSRVPKKSDTKAIRNIVLSWIFTLPIAALISAMVFSLLSYDLSPSLSKNRF